MPRKFTPEEKHSIVNFCFTALDMSKLDALAALKYQEQASLRMELAKSNLNGLLARDTGINFKDQREFLVKLSFEFADEMLNQENKNE